MKQVAGYGGMCRQSSTFKADERSACREIAIFDGLCGASGMGGLSGEAQLPTTSHIRAGAGHPELPEPACIGSVSRLWPSLADIEPQRSGRRSDRTGAPPVAPCGGRTAYLCLKEEVLWFEDQQHQGSADRHASQNRSGKRMGSSTARKSPPKRAEFIRQGAGRARQRGHARARLRQS